ncbi:hypothetical protein D6C84_07664 [Aureobasidium pullulans]|uniref:Uncharacterized protein n=1 Tax=Aureobasidium pullulans TaxID=5580 RepID=A0A4S8UBJ1_AURPU|nr:hypothetical protein D6D27_03363 [Aureobasidium pullulans]THW70373.1 hypothetical protein D6D19_07861 [Aureobasidium pullulans]THX87066.1 hypothetical protein D6D05_02284 [Aureobasidium pullulans]THY42517.1 hypothetical protein D6C99_07419 [Aureobasidium pullulans]THZ80135.1 hypothetical protein D6C84_07664 [Aureobasidium pullulans]
MNLSEDTKKDYAAKLKAAGNKAYGSKDYNRAIDLYGQALLCKADPVFYSNRAACWNAMSNWERVIADTTAAVNLDPEYTGEGYNEAAEAFEKAIEAGDLSDNEAFAYNMRGTFKYLRGETEAIDDLNKSIELDATLTQSYVKRASMHLEAGRRDEAAKDFEDAINQNDKDPDVYYHRAQLNFILGDFPEAAKDYQKSIDLDPGFIFSHIQLGVTQYKMGSIASSMATFRRCMKNFDKVPDVYNYYGELLLDQQKYQEAIEKFETAVQMEQKERVTGMNVLPLINKALALFQWKQDFKSAQELCEKALIIDPECDIAVATMAQLLLQQGKVPEALEYFEKAAELSRTEGEIVNALSYAEATRTQLEVQEKYPQLANRLQGMPTSANNMR